MACRPERQLATRASCRSASDGAGRREALSDLETSRPLPIRPARPA